MKNLSRSIFFILGLAGLATWAQAQVSVQQAWVRASVPQQQATGAFMLITSAKDSRLVGATSSLTPSVEVHEMAMQDNVMRMRQVPAVELPAGKTVALQPGGYHVMLMGLKQPVVAGDTVPLTLSFANHDGTSETVQVRAEVRPLNSSANTSAKPAEHKH